MFSQIIASQSGLSRDVQGDVRQLSELVTSVTPQVTQTLGEGRAMEEGFAEATFAGATDLTPSGTAVDIVDGLAILEEYAATVYGGNPVIHVPRGVGTRLFARHAIVRGARTLETGLGSLVAAGAGYADITGPSDPATGATWMFATGTVLVHRGAIKDTDPAMILGTQPNINEWWSLVERVYNVGVECFVAAVEVTATACCGSGGVDGGSP